MLIRVGGTLNLINYESKMKIKFITATNFNNTTKTYINSNAVFYTVS